LLVAPRSGAEPLTSADRRLLEALARQAGPAVHALRLTLDLVDSRERLVAAREEERRRIRRDLHDGLGPTLAAIGLRAEVAGDLATRDPAAAERVLTELRGEVGGALADIRRLVDALRPPALDELGLVGALQAQAGRFGASPSVEVEADGPLPELPAAVEVAAYRIALEAMTNAARHANASSCRVRLGERPSELDAGRALELEVEDDGTGLPPAVTPGIGLVSMRERAAEVGGTCIVESLPGRGTRVLARLPLGAPATAA
jgi:signal transduction histidine kinase